MIHRRVGDATQPPERPAIIAHGCNDIGAWGAGFVLAVSKRWPQPEQAYRSRKQWELGTIELVHVESDLYVANMITQRGLASGLDPVPLDYEALDLCLYYLNLLAEGLEASVHMPKIGAGLAGGDWSSIFEIIKHRLTVFTYVYTLPRSTK
jgi:O-acetyl-ADP-ribose deacetylase (regulator of RNase III)